MDKTRETRRELFAYDMSTIKPAGTFLARGAVVFGKVEEGMQIVRRMEACGTRSGKPSKSVVIADCGELPSRRQILSRLVAQKEEEANLKKDPLQVRRCSAADAKA